MFPRLSSGTIIRNHQVYPGVNRVPGQRLKVIYVYTICASLVFQFEFRGLNSPSFRAIGLQLYYTLFSHYNTGMSYLTPQRFIQAMHDSANCLYLTLKPLSQETVTTKRDPNEGVLGWTVLEVICHLRDFEQVFFHRAAQIVDERHPVLEPVDHLQLAEENEYSAQVLDDVLEEWMELRADFLTWFADRSNAEWERPAHHPEQGDITLLGQLVQISTHDLNHLEQILRILHS